MSSVYLRRQHRKRILFLVGFLLFVLYWFVGGLSDAEGSTAEEWKEQSRLNTVRRGLELKDYKFFLDNKELRILSGAMHYFRIVPEYWLDRLTRMKAAGLNTVETYVPWNLHEEIHGEFVFTGMLDIRRFVAIAEKVGLLVILRPGPFICSEWEFGGLPSWLLRDPQMDVRSTYRPFMDAARSYMRSLISELEDMQYQYGGPIIAMQIENEYGSYSDDVNYMQELKNIMTDSGVIEILFTSDNKHGLQPGRVPGVFMTTNFKNTNEGGRMFDKLHELQPGKPLMVMEFWSGWFDHWEEKHHTMSLEEYASAVEYILQQGSSINLYMFHGGTNFGFLNGANTEPYLPTVTSYDYDSPLSEAGDVTDKFMMTRQLFAPLNNRFTLPPIPHNPTKAAYGERTRFFHQEFSFSIVLTFQVIQSHHIVSMEMLDINRHGGQSFGFIVYSKRGAQGMKMDKKLMLKGTVRDRAQVLCDDQEISVVDWKKSDQTVVIPKGVKTIDIVVENLGRVNYASKSSNHLNEQRKGLSTPVYLDGKPLLMWDIYPLELKPAFIRGAMASKNWENFQNHKSLGPGMYRTALFIDSEPHDTFLHMKGWKKGVVFVNSFNLGRYWDVGPQETLYVPAPLLVRGANEVVIFELHQPGVSVQFLESPILG
ncbi:hypothetical protein CAPTEDRAFT_112460 [Capitella teleta]|uniref:Beta-galactosidase n=1 Tax=Capitella teleta TaxID=283909 RepID=R7TVM0_CAPTE|nr:hypothetical protein CAPTEDRAFT_112460 [Capitella teleta]|eukprot:ELT97928.1 hypothetical protein CAPTEDRAFT_112460 [Capitella teleta]